VLAKPFPGRRLLVARLTEAGKAARLLASRGLNPGAGFPADGARPARESLLARDVYGSRLLLTAPFGYDGDAPDHWYAARQSRGAAPWLPSAAAVREPLDRTRRAADLVAEAIRLARSREPRPEITGSRWQASTREVRDWALGAGFQPRPDGSIPEQAIAAYDQTHPDRPY
jgi:hypothetical protein